MSNLTKYNFLMIVTSLLLAGCLKDDYSDCPRPFQVVIRALDADMIDITHLGDVEHVYLYMFDEKHEYIDHFVLNKAQIVGKQPINVSFEYGKEPKSITFEAWANLDERVDFASPDNVSFKTDLFVKKKERHTRQESTRLYANSPGDLFQGSKSEIEIEYGGWEHGVSHVVDIHRKTTGITITARGMREYFTDLQSDDYHFEIVESAVSDIDHNGNHIGNTMRFALSGNFNTHGNYYVPTFRVFLPATQSTITVDIYHNNQLLRSVVADKTAEGNPIENSVGRTVNIELIFDPQKPEIDVITRITPWNVEWQYVVWN